MRFAMLLTYTGENGSAKKYVEEMEKSGTAEGIRAITGCVQYEYYASMKDKETVLLVDMWESQAALDAYHASPLMGRVAALREKYNLHMTARRFYEGEMPAGDNKFIRK